MRNLAVNLEAIDTLFFRDHRPFTAGEDTYAESILPSPLTLYGAISSCYLQSIGKSLSDFKNNHDEKLGRYSEELKESNLKIKGMFLVKNGKFYLPTPANFYGYGKDKKELMLHLAKVQNSKPYEWDIDNTDINPLSIPKITNKDLEQVNGFIELDYIKPYFLNNIPRNSVYYTDDFFIYENRYGNTLSGDLLTVDNLYSAVHLRFYDEVNRITYSKASIAVIIEGLDENDFTEKTISLGGERRRARLTLMDKVPSLTNPDVLTQVKNKKKFFLYLLTPAIFNSGWLPPVIGGAKLVGAAINKPQYISGWKRNTDASGSPRPMKKAVPAGSVYFYIADKWTDEQFVNCYKEYNFNQSLSEIYPAAGFGITIIGFWDY